MEPTRTVVFVCLHGAAKSVIAVRYLQRLAEQRGLNVHATAAGIDPDPGVPPPVVKALLAEGIDVRGHRPRRVTHEELARAWRVVSFGCDLADLPPPDLTVDRRDDVPPISENLNGARDLIAARVSRLLDEATSPREERLAKSPSSSASSPTHPDRQTG